MAELADALDSGSNGCKAVQVQVLSPAPLKRKLEMSFFAVVAELADAYV